MAGQLTRGYGQKDTNSMNETITGNKTFTGLNDFSDGKVVLPVATPVNAVAASGTMTVVARPASYVKNVQATSTISFTASSSENQVITIDGTETYTIKDTVGDPIFDIQTGDEVQNAIDFASKISGNPNSKVTASRVLNDVILTFKNSIYLGDAGNTKAFTTDVTGASIVAPAPGSAANQFGGGVPEVSNYRTVGTKNYIFTTTGDGTDPVTDLGASFVRVDSALGASVSDVGLALRTAVDTDPLWVVTGSGATCTVTALVKGTGTALAGTGNFAPFVNNCETAGEVLPLATTTVMSGGINGTPGYKGMTYHDATTNETWETSEDNYTETQSGWYNTANSASNITALALKQDKALSGQTAPTNNVYPTLITGTGNSALIHRSKTAAAGAGLCTIRYVAAAGAEDNLSVAVTGNDVVVTLGKTGGNLAPAKNTAILVLALLNGTPAVLALFKTYYSGTSNGSGSLGAADIALNVQPFAGGVLGTVGYLDQVVYSGTAPAQQKWTCIRDCDGAYFWAPDGVPALNTEYPDYYDGHLASIVFKRRISITVASTSPYNQAHGISVIDTAIEFKGIWKASAVSEIPLGQYGSGTGFSYAQRNLGNYNIYFGSVFNGLTLLMDVKYIK